MNNPTKIDQVLQTWNLLARPGSVHEFRAPKCGKYKTVSGYFNIGEKLAAAVEQWDGSANLYLTLNPVNPALLARAANQAKPYAENTTADADIRRRYWLPVDLDAKRPSGISASAEEHDRALARAAVVRDFLCRYSIPSVLADSGNGGHLMVPIDLPNDEASRLLVEGFLQALGLLFDDEDVQVDTTCANAARIWKIYGTLACKGENMPDRPHRYASILEVPTDQAPVPVDRLQQIAGLLPKTEVSPPGQAAPYTGRQFDLMPFLSEHGLRVVASTPLGGGKVRHRLAVCPFNPEHRAPDAAVFEYPDGKIGFSCFHNSCSGKGWTDVRELFEPGYQAEKARKQAAWEQRGQHRAGDRQGHIVEIVDIVDPNGASQTEWESLLPMVSAVLPTFPTEVLPSWLRAFVEATSDQTATPPDLTALLCLSACALSVAKTAVVEAGSNWFEPLNLFTVTSMPPGSRKSAVFAAVTEPIDAFEEQMARQMGPQIAEGRTEYEILKARAEKARKDAAHSKADTRMEAESDAKHLAQTLAEMKVPVPIRLVVDDCTPERVASLLSEQEGRLAILSPEGGLFEIISGRYSEKGGNMEVYLQGHAGDTVRVDRVGRPPEYIKAAALTVGITVQPDVLRGLHGKPGLRGRGLLGRFLYALPESNLGFRPIHTPCVPFAVSSAYHAGISRLLDLKPLPGPEEHTSAPYRLPLEAEARREFDQYRQEVEKKLRPGEELGEMTDWGGKLCGAIARIAGILHLAEYADQTRRISLATMRSAIALSPYLIAHARAAFAEMGMSEENDRCRAIVEWIQRKDKTEVRKRDLQYAMPSRFPRAADLDKPLEILCERNYLRKAPPAKKTDGVSKKGEIYEVNPDQQYRQFQQYVTTERDIVDIVDIVKPTVTSIQVQEMDEEAEEI